MPSTPKAHTPHKPREEIPMIKDKRTANTIANNVLHACVRAKTGAKVCEIVTRTLLTSTTMTSSRVASLDKVFPGVSAQFAAGMTNSEEISEWMCLMEL